jgi:hypothetical protein
MTAIARFEAARYLRDVHERRLIRVRAACLHGR